MELAERAYHLAPDDLETAEMLAECLAEALDSDFASYRGRLPLLKELQAGGALTRLQVLRIEAQGLLASGDLRGSAAACLQMYRDAGSAHEPITIGRNHQTQLSRWVASQMAAIGDAFPAEARTELVSELRREVGRGDDDPRGERLERFLAFFGSLREFDDLRIQRARRMQADGRVLESQQQLLDLVDSADAAVRREAVARIAKQLHEAGQHLAAREYDDLLLGEFADEPCLDGATGREVVDAWTADIAASRITWPMGKVAVHTVPSTGGAAAVRGRAPVWTVRLEHSDSILGGGAGFLARRGGELTWQDGYGRDVFAFAIDAEGQTVFRQSGSMAGASRGSLLVLSLGRELAALNTLAAGDGGQPLVWRASLGSNFDYEQMYLEEVTRSADGRPGTYHAPRIKMSDKWIGLIGPLTSGGCIFQDQRRLACVDLATGEAAWSRSDVPPGCELFGDERCVFAVPNGSTTAKVYSSIDGRSLGEARVPPWQQQLMTRGRQMVRWRRTDDGQFELSAVDPLTDEPAWRRTFAEGSEVDADGSRFVAVVEPQGKATIIDAATGEAVLEQEAEIASKISAVHLFVGAESFTVVVEHPPARNTDRDVRSFNGEGPVVDGEVIVLDRAAGGMRWSRPATVLRQSLLLDQPPDLPFVIFAGTLSARTGTAGRETTTLLLVDKATGRTLLAADDIPQGGAGYCLPRVTNAAEHEVTIELPGRSLVLQFTDERRPPEPPAMAEVESGAGRVSRGIMGIFRNVTGAE